jgi:hypothetical protein
MGKYESPGREGLGRGSAGGFGAPIYRGQVVKEYLAVRASKRNHLERLPAYAPELNTD